MRKRMIGRESEQAEEVAHNWLNLEEIAEAELSSELESYPIEMALNPQSASHWQAAEAGEQTIRLRFDQAQDIKMIRLLFNADSEARTQEFVLRCSTDGGNSYQDIARQQYNFSPPDAMSELEDYHVNLHAVTSLELVIVPNISGGSARATLSQWLLA